MLWLDADDTATEVQTNFDSSQNFAMIVKFTILHPVCSYNTKYNKASLNLVHTIKCWCFVGIHRYERQRNYIKI